MAAAQAELYSYLGCLEAAGLVVRDLAVGLAGDVAEAEERDGDFNQEKGV